MIALLLLLLAPVPVPRVEQGPLTIVADYRGPTLTHATCYLDGLAQPATLMLASLDTYGLEQQGLLRCDWSAPALGDHVVVIVTHASVGSASSEDFQFTVVERTGKDHP